jgi:hypothetical protein
MESVMEAGRIESEAATLASASLPEDRSCREGLEVLSAGVNACPIATEAGRLSLARQATGHLANRFAVESYLAQHPGLLEGAIEQPVFVLGAPRTGTTLMVNLLGVDASARTLRKWEANWPVPPARAGELSTDPRCIEANEERRCGVAEGRLQTNVHFEWYDEPTECVYVLMQDFKSTAWDAFLPMPAYSEFLLSCDMEPAYRWHRRVLQHLQENNAGRWTLKAPGHALFARDLLKVYPDAKLIWMHRDPTSVVASHASLNAGVHRRFAEHADLNYIAEFYPRQLAAHVDRMLDVESAHPGQVFNVLYEDVVERPVETVEALHAQMGLPLDEATSSAVAQWVADHPRGAGGEHKYSLEQFGIDPARVERLFASYLERLAELPGLTGARA